MLSVRDRLVAEFEGHFDPLVITPVVARCQAQLRGQGLSDAALPELVERLARADLVECLATRSDVCPTPVWVRPGHPGRR